MTLYFLETFFEYSYNQYQWEKMGCGVKLKLFINLKHPSGGPEGPAGGFRPPVGLQYPNFEL